MTSEAKQTCPECGSELEEAITQRVHGYKCGSVSLADGTWNHPASCKTIADLKAENKELREAYNHIESVYANALQGYTDNFKELLEMLNEIVLHTGDSGLIMEYKGIFKNSMPELYAKVLGGRA